MSAYLEKSKKYKGYHYSVLSTEMIEYLHSKTLEMLKIVISIFEDNDIQYMICGGTLLGAFTTGKFIPWDDDVDICVLEDDYDKAINLLINFVPSWIFVQSRKTEANYYHDWVKVRDTKSIVYPNEEIYQNNGVWIDIYKLKKIKYKWIDYQLIKGYLAYLLRRRAVHGITFNEFIDRIISNNLIWRLIKNTLLGWLNKNNSSKYIIWSASKILLNENWLFPRQRLKFENIDVYSFAEPEMYLVQHYGSSFKEIPPEELRRIGINRVIRT